MARSKKIQVLLVKDKEEREWIATPSDGPRIEQRHPNPYTAISNLGDQLRQQLGDDIELEYDLKLPPSLQSTLDALRKKEQALLELSDEVKMDRYKFAEGCTSHRMKQNDIAEFLKLSQSYVNTVLRTKGHITHNNSVERLLSSRRRNL